MSTRIAGCVALFLLPASASAGSVEQALLGHLRDTAALQATLREITEGVGPRLSGSPALLCAHRLASDRLRALGLAT